MGRTEEQLSLYRTINLADITMKVEMVERSTVPEKPTRTEVVYKNLQKRIDDCPPDKSIKVSEIAPSTIRGAIKDGRLKAKIAAIDGKKKAEATIWLIPIEEE